MINTQKLKVAVPSCLLIGGLLFGNISFGGETLEAEYPVKYESYAYSGKTIEKVSLKPGQYQNPILSGYYPDPSVTRVGNDFYLVTSTFTHFPGLPVFHSKDLVNWKQIGNAIDRTDQLDFSNIEMSTGAFAPDISYHNGTFYIVNTCVWCRGNFVITAKNPEGPWSNPNWLDFEGIDPSIFWEGDKAYIVNNGAPKDSPLYDGHRAIWIQEFDWKSLKMVGERTQLINGGVNIKTKPIWIEGPHLFKRNEYFYITAAEGGTGDGHSQTIFRSRELRGPYVPAKTNPILTQRDLDPKRGNPITSAGHAKFIQLPNGEWWSTFLATRPYSNGLYNIGRETFLLPVSWEDDWPSILPPSKAIPFIHDAPPLAVYPNGKNLTSGDFAYVDEFEGEALAMQWIGMRTPFQPFYKVQKGQLQLSCQGRLGDLTKSPSFIGRRQQHHVANISTTMFFSPTKNGQGAGLAAVQNDEAFVFFGVEEIEGKAKAVLYSKEGASPMKLVAAENLTVTEEVTLSIVAEAGSMSFTYEVDGKEKILSNKFDVTHLSTSKAGGFVGTVIGPYCYK